MTTEIDSADIFKNEFKKWLHLDNQIRNGNAQIKELRQKKDTISQQICNYMKTHDMQNKKIETADSKIEFCEKKEYATLSFGFLEKHLGDIIPDPDHVEYILTYLKGKRDMRIKPDLKRIFNKGRKLGTAKAYDSNGYETE